MTTTWQARGNQGTVVWIATAVGTLVATGAVVGIYVESGEIASRDAFISPWIVIVAFAVIAAIVSLASSAFSLLVERICASRGVPTPVRVLLALTTAAVVGAAAYMIVAGWWAPAIGFILAALLEVTAVGIAMGVTHRVSRSPRPR